MPIDGHTDLRPELPVDTITVMQEVVVVEKRAVESGRARVTVSVTEHDETVAALLMRQDVVVERVPVGRMVTEAPALRQEGDTIVVPVMEEVLVTEKRLVLKEELRIRIVETAHETTQVVTLRREHATIDHGDAVAGSTNARSTT